MKISPVVAWLIRVVGLAVFAVAFLLPALGLDPHDDHPLMGWKCASIALSMPFSKEAGFNLDVILVSLSGWLNFFVLLYLVLCLFKRLKVVRWVFVGLCAVSMISTWAFFGRQHYTPLMGHFLWIAGAVTVILPEFFGSKQQEKTVEPLAKFR